MHLISRQYIAMRNDFCVYQRTQHAVTDVFISKIMSGIQPHQSNRILLIFNCLSYHRLLPRRLANRSYQTMAFVCFGARHLSKYKREVPSIAQRSEIVQWTMDIATKTKLKVAHFAREWQLLHLHVDPIVQYERRKQAFCMYATLIWMTKSIISKCKQSSVKSIGIRANGKMIRSNSFGLRK